MSSRYISIEEINSILAAVEDESGIKLLKGIRDNITGEPEERKKESKKLSLEEQQKEQQEISKERSFVGYAKEEDLGIKDDEGQKGILRRLEEQGLIIKGGFIPLGEERINSYKLTNEGYALLYLCDRIKGGKQSQPTSPQAEQRETRKAEREESRNNREDNNTIKANESVKIRKE